MIGLDARIHRAGDPCRVGERPTFGDTPPEPFLVACPHCGDERFAGIGPYDEPAEPAADAWEARGRHLARTRIVNVQ